MNVGTVGLVHPGRPLDSAARTEAGAAAPSAAEAAPQKRPGVPYISPVMRFDQEAQISVLMFRDSDTGDVRAQFPPKKVVEEYRRQAQQARPPETPGVQTPGAEAAAAAREPVRTGSGREAGSEGGARPVSSLEPESKESSTSFTV